MARFPAAFIIFKCNPRVGERTPLMNVYSSRAKERNSTMQEELNPREPDMELADWLRCAANELQQYAALPDDRVTDPFSEPEARVRAARLIARAAAKAQNSFN